MLSGFVRNWASLTGGIHTASGQRPQVPYGSALVCLIDERRFPAISAAIAGGAIDDSWDVDAEFTFGLGRMLDGVENLTRAAT
jgi:hypothetical protein